MKPLKQLPILRLPFRVMEEVYKGMHSIMKMISNRRSNKFPILRLPFLAIEEIFKAMDPFEIMTFSKISKRTKTVTKNMGFFSKYDIHFCVDKILWIYIRGTNGLVSCNYIITWNEKLDGKIEEEKCFGRISRRVYKYSENPIEEWKQLCIYVLEIFKKQTIAFLQMRMDAFVDQNVSIIDFLKSNVKSVDGCYLHQWYQKNNVDENFTYFLNNITINNKLDSWLHIKNGDFDGKIPTNLKELIINNSQWIGFERLLEIDCKHVVLRNNRITNEEWNMFLKNWIAMETHMNLESLEFDYTDLEEFRDHVLPNIPHEVISEEVSRIVACRHYQTQKIKGGIDILRIDGKTATFFVRRRRGYEENVLMCTH
ncbi:hypothetical protein CRE_09797 [Caenorhabditis remanei]|uniref:F-box domain-containing protein n=1 Tax=Caenorhabditis remanei TaxID=31234 RepID=E3NDG2_CAERE|nr:hypothetical protein CRE_09797 [Caenorhabditis remanei]